jgi:hypothetical protein
MNMVGELSEKEKQAKFVQKMVPSWQKGEEGALHPDDFIDTLPKALDYLRECDAALNAAYLIKNDERCSLLIYEATFFFPKVVPHAFIPEDPKGMEAHLYSVFKPFLYTEDQTVRSVINARALEPVGKTEKVQLTMLLYFPRKLHEDVYKKLELLSDGRRTVETDFFSLD